MSKVFNMLAIKSANQTLADAALLPDPTFLYEQYYEGKFKEQFNLLTITNNHYSSSAKILAKSNDIKLLNQEHLENLVNQNSITIQDFNKIESQRMIRV